ncbi:MAG: Cytochrome c4 [uncultured Thiotrichaceae bacterium]|uniref:Cytochrome c4 n=1 Tax=uncultured Thiotrichaceae bacterium TaxID=298394 RepID=A0A6S6U1B1_9GAMM|nr:MAG: Cytochrome c4 [uncultured Thiotrichaceae bacterium]
MKKTLIMVLAGLAVSASTTVLANSAATELKGDPAKGKSLSATCAACHGADGNSTNPEWPKLAGQHESYLLKQLQNFKAGQDVEGGRYNASMAPMVAGLSNQDMADLAAYYSSQTAKQGEADQTMVELGRQIYKGGNNASGVAACAACHGPNGSGNPASKFPALAGQHAKYTAIQLEAFSKYQRANDAGQMMRNIADKMTDAEMAAVSEYISGLQNQ